MCSLFLEEPGRKVRLFVFVQLSESVKYSDLTFPLPPWYQHACLKVDARVNFYVGGWLSQAKAAEGGRTVMTLPPCPCIHS